MFKVHELLKAARGSLVCGSPEQGVLGISIDSRTINRGEAFIAIKGDNFDGHDFIKDALNKGAGCIIRQKGPAQGAWAEGGKAAVIKVSDTARALGDIARFHRSRFDIPVIAVTGSNGKTTTKDMIAWVLQGELRVLKNEGTKNNHIGLPLALLGLKKSHDIAVVEAGTNHFGEIDYLCGICKPNVGVITEISPAHLEHFGSLKGVLEEKYRLIGNLERPQIAVLNGDNRPLAARAGKESGGKFIVRFGTGKTNDFCASGIRRLGPALRFVVNLKHEFRLNTPGRYNVYNSMAAAAIGRIFGIDYRRLSLRLACFEFPQGRLKVMELNSVRFIDDTYNSNPLSLKHALDVLAGFKTPGRKIFVMGDMLELGRHKETFHLRLGKEAAGVCDVLITVGRLSRLAARTAEKARLQAKNIFVCRDCAQARDVLFNKLSVRSPDVVLVKGSRAMKMEQVISAESAHSPIR